MGEAVAKTAARTVAWRAHEGFQRRVMKCPVREMLVGGAKGSGKTEVIGPKALKHVKTWGHLGATVLILRQTFKDLSEIIERVTALFRRAGGRYIKSEYTWRFPNGGRVKFGHLQDGCDPYWGHEYSLIIIDEVTRCIPTEKEYLKLLGSLRNSKGIPCQVILTSNPGGEGHEWVKARFKNVDPFMVQHDRRGLARVFIPGYLHDNPTLDPEDGTGEYRANLEQLPDAERRAFLDGDWDAFTGQVFKIVPGVHTWTRARFAEHVKGEPLCKAGIPLAWKRYRLMDWGFAHPYCVLWFAIDFDGRAWVYREVYGVKVNAEGVIEPNVGSEEEGGEVALIIKDIESEAGEKVTAAYSGPDLWHRKGRQMGDMREFYSWFEEKGVYFDKWDASPGTRLAGKMALHERLKFEKDEKGNPAPDFIPGIVFISEACPHTIRTLPTLTYDEHQPELVSKKGEDHPYDVVKAFCLLYAWAPKKDVRTPAQKFRDDHKRRSSAGGRTWMSA